MRRFGQLCLAVQWNCGGDICEWFQCFHAHEVGEGGRLRAKSCGAVFICIDLDTADSRVVWRGSGDEKLTQFVMFWGVALVLQLLYSMGRLSCGLKNGLFQKF